MSGRPVIEQLLLQDRVITGSAMGLILLIAVIYTILGVGMPMSAVQMTAMNAAKGMAGTSEGQAMHSMQTNGLMMPAMWTTTYAGLVFLMWWIMMIAMMLPSVASTVLLYTTLIRRGKQAVNAPKLALLFLTGYLAVWGLFSLLATLAQWFLELRGFVSTMDMALTSNIMGATVLIIVGIYQFTPWKQSCLERCRSPLQFLTERRRDGPNGALLMGIEHGAFCVGCCWCLMALLLVGGLMNLYWIAGLMLFVLIEKLIRFGDKVSRLTGLLMAGAGIYLLVST
jgi:predicted metal-binding membrane protein